MRAFPLRRLPCLVLSAVVLCGVLCPRGTRAQESRCQECPPPEYANRIQAFKEFVRAAMPGDRIPGMTVGFAEGDYTWVEGFGFADLEHKTPARPESAYRLASITKSMTGEAIVQLAERGKLDLDAEIQTYVPDYPKQKWPVTVRNLLTHTGGGQVGSGLGPEHVTPKEVVARISKYPIQYETGTRYDYQTSGYNLLGAAIENVSGKSFDEYLRENLFLPAGMKDTRMDDVRALVPNRVRGYELDDKGETVNAPFLDVSSRFGGGGLTGTVPDLLRWPPAAFAGKILSPKWVDEMLKPFTSKSGRFTGLGDGDTYYTLGWMLQPVNGVFAAFAAGSQKGTETIVYHFPERRLTIAVACNLQFAPTGKYVRRLYELLTGDAWEARVFTRAREDAPAALALDSAYNYGSMHFGQRRAPLTADAKELADAFAFFNSNVTREAARADFQAASRRIRDARHPAGGLALVKLGSYVAARLKERNGAAALDKYRRGGAIPFFADYVRLYKSDSSVPKQLRFTPAFEKLIERWDADWSRTWNEYTRTLVMTPETDFDAVGARLRKEFAGAEVYPDYVAYLQPIQQGIAALKAPKLGVELYPHSDELLFNLAYFIIVYGQSEGGRAAIKAVAPDHEPPAAYLRRAFESNPDGVMRAKTFLDVGGGWLKKPERTGAGVELLGAAAGLHTKDAAVREMFGDFLRRAGRTAEAEASYRKAFALDPNVAKGSTLEAYLAGKLAPAPTATPKP
ncbi:MAG TPA: serine hydrolase domain-containing protein [Pyrinomonadaceae bacterium]|nr:serine hydrolase domain-containing protein [Pyrinomonadaceae bacterium]